MLISEIEEAERQAEGIVSKAREQAGERLRLAKTRSFEFLVEDAEKKGKELLRRAEEEGKELAKKVPAPKKAALSPQAKQRIAREFALKAVREAKGV